MKVNFTDVLNEAQRLQRAKEKTYGDSWRKDGEFLSVFPNVARKYDRLHNIILAHVNKGASLPEGDAAIAQGVMDLLVYCGLWLTLIAEERPEEWKELVMDIEREVDSVKKL